MFPMKLFVDRVQSLKSSTPEADCIAVDKDSLSLLKVRNYYAFAEHFP